MIQQDPGFGGGARAEASESQPLQGQFVKDAILLVRMEFIRKVYSILCVQLVLTCAIAYPLQKVDKAWILKNQWLLVLSCVMTLATICAMSCCKEEARRFPTNYALLFTFTAFEGVCVGFFSAAFEWQSVLLAAGVTLLVFMGLTFYACTTSSDFTGMGPYLFGAICTLCMFGFVLMLLNCFGITVPWMFVAYDLLGVLVFVFYIIYDTQLILGERGGHKNQFGIDDYAFAALNLYIDIIQLFLHILSLFGKRR